MRKFEIESKLQLKLKKLFRKNKIMYEIIWKKINEIINASNIDMK